MKLVGEACYDINKSTREGKVWVNVAGYRSSEGYCNSEGCNAKSMAYELAALKISTIAKLDWNVGRFDYGFEVCERKIDLHGVKTECEDHWVGEKFL